MQGAPLSLQRARSDSDVDSPLMGGFDFEVSLGPQCCDALSAGQLSPGRAPSSYGGASRRSYSVAAAAAAEVETEQLKRRVVAVLEEKGWGQ